MFEMFKWRRLPEGEKFTLGTILTIIFVIFLISFGIFVVQWSYLLW